ncbi:MAG: N-acetylmuramoyl-L-alanine amidase [Brevibacillus sp.]|nr:N-acetylmuramoyl-L-alanine amidase [Brevibacillus sp.]
MRHVVGKLMILLCAVLMLPVMTAAAAGAGESAPIHLVIEGKQVQADVPPLIQNGRTMVPIRVIAEGLGADVSWNQSSQTAVITQGERRLELKLNSPTALVNGKQMKLDAPPLLKNDRMLLPLRFVGEALGLTVGWEANSRTVVANPTVTIVVNGENLSASLKGYQLADTLYVPFRLIAEKVGMEKNKTGNAAHIRVIDSQEVAPLNEVKRMIEQLPGGSVEWDESSKRLHIKRVSYLTGIKAEGADVNIRVDGPVEPRHFVLAGPHRIVIDLPSTVLSDEMLAKLGVRTAAAEGDEQKTSKSEPEEETRHSDGTTMPDWLFDEEEQVTLSAASEAAAREQAGKQKAAADGQESLIKEIRYSQFSESPYTVRVVIELNQQCKYTVTQGHEGLTVQLTPIPRKTGFMIVVDAGHGAHDPGARGTAGNWEKDFNLAVANRMMELLKQYPEFQPVATRTTDVFLELQERVALANEYEADLFISIHANSFSNAGTRGTETYYYNDYSEPFARIVHKHLVKATGFPDRKVRKYPFYVIRHTKMPAVLTETGFMSNPTENAELMKPEFQDKVARALVAAIREYYESYY